MRRSLLNGLPAAVEGGDGQRNNGFDESLDEAVEK
ncbi:hypothetical protein PMI29_05258 [Pseudomonas sp. GM49]|nr:hypothetical protein PMI29_05258 [Pseudomonas sp. GM49]